MELKPGDVSAEMSSFPNDWEITSLGDAFQFLPTANNPRSDLSLDGDIRYLHYGDIHTKWQTSLDCSLGEIPRIEHRYLQQVPFLEEGDLVVADASEDYEGIGKIVEIMDATGKKIVAGLHTLLLRGDDTLTTNGFRGYIQYYPCYKSQLRRIATGISVFGVSKSNLQKVSLPLPPLPEQRAIAEVLGDVGALIAAMDQLIAKKRAIKQGAMQQLLTGKTRLPGFSGEFREKKLAELASKFLNGGTPSTNVSEYWTGSIPWITGADVENQKIAEIRRFITKDAVRNSSTNIVDQGNLLIVTRTGVGKLAIAPFDIAISQDFTGIYIDREQALPEFIYRYIDFQSDSLKKLNQGTSIEGITRETLESFRVFVPSLPEQKAIAEVLSEMDIEIAALEARREKTRALKEGLMQELLTGRIRLV